MYVPRMHNRERRYTRKSNNKLLYIIAHPHGFVKIGVSKEPEQRCKKLQTGCPYKLEVYETYECDEPYIVEQILHERYDEYRREGEWFDLPYDKSVEISDLCAVDGHRLQRLIKDADERRRDTLMWQGLVG